MLASKFEVFYTHFSDNCGMMPGQKCRMLCRFVDGANAEYNSWLVRHGYRHFGKYYSAPVCPTCTACINVRFDATRFEPSKSLRRVAKKNVATKVVITKQICTPEILALCNEYHDYMHLRRGWDKTVYDEKYYNEFFLTHSTFSFQANYFVGDELVCVDLFDVVDDGLNANYCFYSPRYKSLGLGNFSLLVQVNLARKNGLKWIYLGTYSPNCQSYSYKLDFRPCEALECKDAAAAGWKPVEFR